MMFTEILNKLDSQPYRHKVTGEIATQIPIYDINDWEEHDPNVPESPTVDVDSCCEDIRQKLLEHWAKELVAGTNTWPKEKVVMYMDGIKRMDCEKLYALVEAFANADQYGDTFYGDLIHDWDFCVELNQRGVTATGGNPRTGGDFTASMHPFDAGWDSIVKEGQELPPGAKGGGECYSIAGRWVCYNPGYTLAHAQATPVEGLNSPMEGVSFGHAFNPYKGDAFGELIESMDDYDIQERGYPMDWIYDGSQPEGSFLERQKADLYYRMSGIDPDKVIHYTPDETMKLQLEHEHFGPYDEVAQQWLHSEPSEEEPEDDEVLRMSKAEPMQVRGLGITPTIARQIAGDLTGKQRVIAPFKHPGSKNRPSYLSPIRDAYQLTGGDRRVVDPFFGSGTIPHNLAPPSVLGSDIDWDLMNAHRAIQSAPGGFELDWGQHTDEEGILPKRAFYEDIRGGLPRGRGNTEYENVWPPKIGSLNSIVQEGVNRDADLDELIEIAKIWAKMQQAAFQGHTRTNKEGLHNIASGHQGPYADVWNYLHFQGLMDNWELQSKPYDQFFDEAELEPHSDFMPIDPPYMGEGANYSNRGNVPFSEEQVPLANRAGELAEEGMPIVAFNSAEAQDLWADRGFETALHSRMDTTGGSGAAREARPEMVAWANIPGMDASRWFKHHPDKQWATEDILSRFGGGQ